jgi:hypothetical protein
MQQQPPGGNNLASVPRPGKGTSEITSTGDLGPGFATDSTWQRQSSGSGRASHFSRLEVGTPRYSAKLETCGFPIGEHPTLIWTSLAKTLPMTTGGCKYSPPGVAKGDIAIHGRSLENMGGLRFLVRRSVHVGDLTSPDLPEHRPEGTAITSSTGAMRGSRCSTLVGIMSAWRVRVPGFEILVECFTPVVKTIREGAVRR